MFTQAEMIDTLQKTAQNRFPEYPVQVRPSMDEAETLCVYMFCVDPQRVDEVDDAIFALQAELCPGEEYLFLPMIKTLEVTRQYYPEFIRANHSPILENSAAVMIFMKRFERFIPPLSPNGNALSLLLQTCGFCSRNAFSDDLLKQFINDSFHWSVASLDLVTSPTRIKQKSQDERLPGLVDAENGFNMAA